MHLSLLKRFIIQNISKHFKGSCGGSLRTLIKLALFMNDYIRHRLAKNPPKNIITYIKLYIQYIQTYIYIWFTNFLHFFSN